MPLPKCQSCKKEWGYKESLKSTWDFGKNMNCPYCKRKQYLTAKSRKNSMMIMFFIISPLALFFNSSQLWGLVALVLACVVYIGIWPFIIQLSNKEETRSK